MDNYTYYMLLILLFLAIAILNMYRLRRERDDFRKRIEYLIEKEKIFSKEMFVLLLEKSFYDTNDNFKYIVDKETLVSEKDKKEKDFFNKSVFSDMMRDMQETIDFLHKENKELALEIIKLRDEKRELENRENLYEKKSPPFFSFEPSFDNAEEESPLVPIYYNQEEKQDEENEIFVEERKPFLEYKLVDQYYRNCIICFYTKQEEEYVLSKELYIFNFHDYTLRLIRCLNEIFSRENYQRTVNKYGLEYVMSDYIPYSKKDIKNKKMMIIIDKAIERYSYINNYDDTPEVCKNIDLKSYQYITVSFPKDWFDEEPLFERNNSNK